MKFKTIEDGEKIPIGYGYAWRDFHNNRTIILPIGINKIGGWIRRVYHRLISIGRASVIDEAFAAGRFSGDEWEDRFIKRIREHGFAEGYNKKTHEIEVALEKAIGICRSNKD